MNESIQFSTPDFFVKLSSDIADMNVILSKDVNTNSLPEDTHDPKGNTTGNYHFKEEMYINAGEFNKFIKEITQYYSEKIVRCERYALVGQAGIGKSTFFANIEKAMLQNNITVDFEGIKFKPSDGGLIIASFRYSSLYDANEYCKIISDYIQNSLKSNAILNKKYNEQIQMKYPKRKEEIDRERDRRLDINYKLSEFDLLVHLIEDYTFALYEYNRSRFQLVIDNLDLCSSETQEKIIDTVNRLFINAEHNIEIHKRKISNPIPSFILTVAVRDDTYKSRQMDTAVNKADRFHPIYFPKPSVYKIVKNNFIIAAEALKKSEEYANINIGDVAIYNPFNNKNERIKSLHALIDFTLDVGFNLPEKVWDSNSETGFHEFHNLLLDYDVRRWNAFITDCMKHEYLPIHYLIHHRRFRFYDYLKQLIYGSKFTFGKGEVAINEDMYATGIVKSYNNNRYIDREIPQNGMPIMFNLFETYDYVRKDAANNYPNVFMIYIRILQYLSIKSKIESTQKISVERLISDLSAFFGKETVEDALKMMIYTGLLKEIEIGSRNLGRNQNHNDIRLVDYTYMNDDDSNAQKNLRWAVIEFENGCSGLLYLNNLISEFEYISIESLFYTTGELSPLNNYFGEPEVAGLGDGTAYINVKREYRVVKFLTVMLLIVKKNIEYYEEKGIIEDFKKIFMQLTEVPESVLVTNELALTVKPWSRMVNGAREALQKKYKYAVHRYNEKGASTQVQRDFKNRASQLEKLILFLDNVINDGKEYLDKYY